MNRPIKAALSFLCLCVLLASTIACRKAPLPPDADHEVLPTDLAARPVPLSSESATPNSASPGTATPMLNPVESPTVVRASEVVHLAGGTDKQGDAGSEAPGYADLVKLSLDGDAGRASFAVEVAALLPRTLPSNELMFIGVDIYRPGETESDYQLLAEGSPEGWFAYFDTPAGFIDYPGTFEMGDNRMVFRIDWSALADMRVGAISSFCDWSRRRLVLNQASSDALPDSERLNFSR